MIINKIRSIKPIDKIQNIPTIPPIGKNVYVKGFWRYNYQTIKWEWVDGHWRK